MMLWQVGQGSQVPSVNGRHVSKDIFMAYCRSCPGREGGSLIRQGSLIWQDSLIGQRRNELADNGGGQGQGRKLK